MYITLLICTWQNELTIFFKKSIYYTLIIYYFLSYVLRTLVNVPLFSISSNVYIYIYFDNDVYYSQQKKRKDNDVGVYYYMLLFQ